MDDTVGGASTKFTMPQNSGGLNSHRQISPKFVWENAKSRKFGGIRNYVEAPPAVSPTTLTLGETLQNVMIASFDGQLPRWLSTGFHPLRAQKKTY